MTEKAKKWIANNKAKNQAMAQVVEIQPLTIKITHAAKYLDVSVDFIESLIEKGVFKRVVKMGNKMRYLYVRDLEKYVMMQTIDKEVNSKISQMSLMSPMRRNEEIRNERI